MLQFLVTVCLNLAISSQMEASLFKWYLRLILKVLCKPYNSDRLVMLLQIADSHAAHFYYKSTAHDPSITCNFGCSNLF